MTVPDLQASALQDDDPVLAWAASGAMWLTGRPDGPPLVAPGRPAALVVEALAAFASTTRDWTTAIPALPDVRLLGERAALAGLARQGPWSAGGRARALRTADGWLALSLARESDLELVAALVEKDPVTDPWPAVVAWARSLPTAEAHERVALLSLPGRGVSRTGSGRRPVEVTTGGRRPLRRERPLVVDLTSLWAGPLAAHLLGLAGADVVKVESTQRPDGARRGARAFYDLLHAGHRSVALDFGDDRDRGRLAELLRSADLVLEASRPRALARLGVQATELVAEGTTWVSITAEGRCSDAVGFGDDVAAGAGLLVPDGEDLLHCGDALADPLAGVVAAQAAAAALADERASLVDVSMLDVCREAYAEGRTPPHEVFRAGDDWWVETDAGRVPVAIPTARPPAGRAAPIGAHTAEVLAALP